MQHYPAPRNSIARFLCDMPDWSVLDKKALDKAISQLPVPLPGPGPPGISIQDALHQQVAMCVKLRKGIWPCVKCVKLRKVA